MTPPRGASRGVRSKRGSGNRALRHREAGLTEGWTDGAALWDARAPHPFRAATTRGGSQTAAAGESKAITFDTTEDASGVSIVDDSRITLATPGTYEVMFSAQVFHAQRAQDAVVEVWFQRGLAGGASSQIAFSNSRMILPPDRDAYDVMTVNLLVTTTAADEFVELYWYTDATEAQLATVLATGGRPAIPAVILTVLPIG